MDNSNNESKMLTAAAEGDSRRNFLKTSLTAGLVAAASGGFALNLGAAGTEPSKRRLPQKWEESYDVVVIGSGFAGLAAAAEAAGKGASVIVLEKMPVYGGNSIINGGEYNAWTDELHLREKLALGDDSADTHKNDTLKGGDYFGSPELVEVLTSESPKALNWMIDEGGLKLRNVLNRTGGHSKYRTHTCVEGVGRGFTEALRKIAEKRGAKIRLKSEVTWIWRKDVDGPVLGLEVKGAKGPINIRARKAVVMASGGFSRDVAMRLIYNPSLNAGYNCTNHKGATGEMIRFAQAIGADLLHMAFIQLYPYADPETGILDAPAVYPFRGPGYGIVYVDEKGKRFVNELERRDVVSRAELATGGKKTFSIFNEKMISKMGTKEEVEMGMARGRFVKADTLEELGRKIGMDGATLKDTITRHNGYLKDKKDPEFGKAVSAPMLLMEEGPYYAIAQWPAVHHTMGGLRTNKEARVLDIWGKPIPRLYAAGEVTGGLHGANRLGGNATPDATVFGRIAGINAASEKA
ncbi:flavocytochrome c [Mesoterricola sediminis]|uniref:Flavocytochrome c n=1 Tax=Mesoterricola sediminis TaxID=2927980 RepID=A0AA48GQU8_9BACT|nr:flavocytochrome c [Mesoterricola sediminis]BDU77576.1 flavocytochrome c [Mesoterricola sediminis]